ncbi:MAG: SDR family NAD(P)-dependent oxidoreductase [Gammaproteobacteria bacterium]|nr:SDR family NAD(P)-dependent oxidoreductase [Gammaproteobacteria bacterium]
MTGASGGIGVPLARLLREAGAAVAVHDQLHDGDLGGDIDALCARLREDPPDILVNLAGYNQFARCEDQDVRGLVTVNLIAPARLIQAVLPGMKRRNSGHIVNIGSMAALIPMPHLGGYAAAKAGLKAFSDALRRELSGSGVRVVFVAPRAVDTGANRGLVAELNRRTGVRYDTPEQAARRIFQALCKGEKDVRIGWPERFFAAVNALMPALVDRGLAGHQRIGEKLLHKSETDQISGAGS